MADIAGGLATGGTALVSAAAGAGLTYWLGSLNRRHQEAREDKTRWYETRFKAYTDFYVTVTNIWFSAVHGEHTLEEQKELATRIHNALAQVQLVGSPEVVEEAITVSGEAFKESAKGPKFDDGRLTPLVDEFLGAARKDLGYTEAL
jgi:hypothetical protein